MKLNKLTKGLMALSLIGILAGCSTDDNTREVTKDFTQDAIESTTKYVNENKQSWKDGLGNLVNKLDDVVGGVMDGVDTALDGSSGVEISGDFADTANQLSELDYESGTKIDIPVNGGVSTLDFNDWNGPKIDYSDLDNLNRTQTATAHLTPNNYGESKDREGQKWTPTAWNNQAKKIDGKEVRPMDRGHLIAYTITFNLNDWGVSTPGELGSIDNPRNLFSQTSYSNRGPFQTYETLVRNAMKDGEDVLYRVQPIYRGDDLMARGVWAQAVSSEGTVNFNTYLYNVQPNFSFDYSTGKSVVDKNMQVSK